MSQRYELVAGLEVHVQLNTASKMFCGCSNDAVGAQPNTLVCPVCYGMPGALPVTNHEAVRKTLLLGKALGCDIASTWNFERKNYFYPDLPKGYQITSATNPPLVGGQVVFASDEQQFAVRFHHIHLEEDAGKLTHGDSGFSYVDLNRSGTPLIEMVTEPDFHSTSDVKRFLQEIRLLIRILGISDGDMENGHLRCDANISVRKIDGALGTKVEIKNLNSFTMVEKAISYEFKRQVELLESGKLVVQETRGWDEGKAVTKSMRSKEDAQDYRYMPEPDIPPVIRGHVVEFSDKTLDEYMAKIDLPNKQRDKLKERQITGPLAAELMSDSEWYKLTIKACDQARNANEMLMIGMFIHDPLMRIASEHQLAGSEVSLTAEDIIKLFYDIRDGNITHQIVKTELPGLLHGTITLAKLEQKAVASKDIDVDSLVTSVLDEHASVVEEWKGGNQKVYGFLVGQVMQKAKGVADPKKVNELLQKKLRLTDNR